MPPKDVLKADDVWLKLETFSQRESSELSRVGQCAKVLKIPNFRAFSESFCLNVYKNAKKLEIF